MDRLKGFAKLDFINGTLAQISTSSKLDGGISRLERQHICDSHEWSRLRTGRC
jgi:hypothetical protein